MAPINCSFIAAVNNESVLQDNLLRSPDLADATDVILKRGFTSAAAAYNAALAEARGDLLIFIHQDVYLPPGWIDNLEACVRKVNAIDSKWGVLGVCGRSRTGEIAGHVHSTGCQATIGKPFNALIETLSLDELLLVIRRSASLRFDERLPGFHLYGTDICYEAKKLRMNNYIMPAFCIHNSNGIRTLPSSFWRAYFNLRRKWWHELPISTCCAEITKGYWSFLASLRTAVRQFIAPSHVGARHPDPAKLYLDLQRSTGDATLV